jgi:hypothetical protein
MQPYSPWSLAAALPFMVGALALLARGLLSRPRTGCRRAALLTSALMLIGFAGDVFLSPVVNAYVSPRPFAEMVVREVDEGADLQLFRKDYDGIYNIHTGRIHIPVIESVDGLREALTRADSYVICDEKRLEKAHVLREMGEREVAGGNVGGRYMMLLRGGGQ